MRIPNYGRNRAVDFNVTPLIDVVFLLIIFFLVSSHLAKQETQLELDLPTASTGSELTESSAPRVTINVLPSGDVLIGGAPSRADQIAARLAFERNRVDGELEVRIRADRAAPFGRVKPLLLACAEASVWDVSFSVVDSREP
ncbi:MAG: biopolymer transporter ExbD [Planctomycetota bacterium]